MFYLTLAFAVVSATVLAFFRGRRRDRCLKEFAGFPVTLERSGGAPIYGRLRVEPTGIEIVYAERFLGGKDKVKTSYILYKTEFPVLIAFVRFQDELDEAEQKRRRTELERTYHPSAWRKLGRRMGNFFNTVRDSVVEVVNMLVGRMKGMGVGGAVIGSQTKTVSKLKEELMGSIGTAYEPLIEPYIGHRVVIEIVREGERCEYSGVLKEYTAEFIEILDVEYPSARAGGELKVADLVVPRKVALVRHLGE